MRIQFAVQSDDRNVEGDNDGPAAVAICYHVSGGCFMAISTPIRVDEDIHAFATSVAPTMSRSTAQQVSHWARIGKELEASPSVSLREIEQVLDRQGSYDDLNNNEQAVVRAEWGERTERRRRGLDFAAEFAAEGRSYVELDDDGSIVRHQP